MSSTGGGSGGGGGGLPHALLSGGAGGGSFVGVGVGSAQSNGPPPPSAASASTQPPPSSSASLPPSSTFSAASLPPSSSATPGLGGGPSSSLPPSSGVPPSSVAGSPPSTSGLPPPSSAASAAASSSVAAHIRTGELLYSQMDKVSSELLAMTYGAIVTQLIKDYKDVAVVNAELEKMGYNVGVRLIDEFLCRASGVSCANFRDTASVIAKVAFKMFLGISAEVGRWRPDGRQCVLSFKGNPLLDFVELPQHLAKLEYSNVIAGVIRGACAMIQMHVTVEFVKDELRGAGESEIRLTLKEILQEEYADDEG